MTEFRIESDTLGEVKIPADVLWGPQTERSRQNFKTGPRMPISLIRVYLQIKKAAAQVNQEMNYIDHDKGQLIEQAVDKLLAMHDAELHQHFPLVVYQTGSGTQTNMNVNEVISHMAAKLNPAIEVLPNDDVNCGQSSNDTFPTAMNITAALSVQSLEPTIKALINSLKEKEIKYATTVKIGRTHLQDATPLTFGQEVSGWRSAFEHDLDYLINLNQTLQELAIGGTAVGTGLNAAPDFPQKVAERLNKVYNFSFTANVNKFYALSNHSGLNIVHGALKNIASDAIKIANDVRFLGSGPRAGYGELKLPANEPGSSIMPGKVNPTQAEALTMASVKVLGNDTTISIAASQGNFEMNVYKPVIIATFLESVELLKGTLQGFDELMIKGLTVNEDRMQELVDNSLMTVTALSPHIGYHHSAEIAQLAERKGLTLKQAALESGYLNEKEFDEWVDPLQMTNYKK